MAANQRSRLIAATIEVVADRGYHGMTVSNVSGLAGVSKASFYQQFSGKDECFVATCDTALREAATAVLRGGSEVEGVRDRLRSELMALAELIAAQPKAAKLLLIDSLAATTSVRDYVCGRFGLLETLIRERLTEAGRGSLPKPLTSAILRGLEHHARRCVGAGCPDRFQDLVDPLLDWGLAFGSKEASTSFAAASIPGPSSALYGRAPSKAAELSASHSARDLLMAAALRLAAREGYAALSPARVRRTAGVSRRSFDTSFGDVATCFLAAVDCELEAVFAEARRAGAPEAAWEERTCHVLERLVASLAGAPDTTRLAFAESRDAAPESLQWREKLVSAWADAIYREAPMESQPSPAVAEAAVAAMWGFLADLVTRRRLHLLPAQSRRLALFVLTPALGAKEATEVIEKSYERFLLSSSCS